MFGSPEPTQYDVRFRLLNIPVRVHPMFWLFMLIISGSRDLLPAVVFVGAAFISILVHEFGHAISARLTGREPFEVVLYAMGGLCFYDSTYQPPWKRILVLLCGPGAGFLLMIFVMGLAGVLYGIHPLDSFSLVGGNLLEWLRLPQGDPINAIFRLPPSPALRMGFLDLLYINFWWGVFNLFPIFPLDGGQVTVTFLGMVFPGRGARWGHLIASLTAALLAYWSLTAGSVINAMFLASFAFLNYQILQSMHQRDRWAESHRYDR